MTLEETIKKFEQKIGEFEKFKKIHAVTHEDYEYIEKTEQLAEWLKELKAVRDIIEQHDRDSMPEDYWYIDKIRMVVPE